MKLTVDRLKADPLFIYYVFKSPATIQRILNHAFSSGVPHINLEILRDFEIEIPKLCVQRKIAAFLSAYDDLIENNTRRIKILEEMAQMLYREWFVHFRFPGHEKVRMVESELGPIPEGWTIRALGDIAKITMGLSPKGDTYNQEGEGTPLINGPVEFGDRFTKAVKWTTTPTKCCEKGDLIVCVRGSTTGRFVKSDGVYCLGRGVCAMNSKYRSFLDLLYVEEMPTLLAQTGGSTFPSWTGPQIKSHRVRYPNEPLLERYEEVARPMRDAVQCYVQANLNLRTTRDLLLPKLISGEVHVEANEGTAAVLQEEIALRV
jgi:type I restriction enzyme S subunit